MPLSSPKRFSFAVPPPKVVLLPDALFFVRAVPIGEAATPAEVATQVELAIESLAPFPLSQLFYGHFFRPGAKHALAYAVYRKRLTQEQIDAWADAELVMPTFAALLASHVERPTALFMTTAEGLTAVHWTDPNDVPNSIIAYAWTPETGEGERELVRYEVSRALEGARTVVNIEGAPEITGEGDDDRFVFRAASIGTSAFTREQIDALDVRDKDDLQARRHARSRDLILWRAFAISAAGIALALTLEFAVGAGKLWQRGRVQTVEAQAPIVARIQTAQNLAERIDELSTKRLQPFEMISAISQQKPASVVFLSTTAKDLYTLEVEAQTNVSADLITYRDMLMGLPTCEKVEIQDQRTRDGTATFRLLVTFKPEAFREEAQS